MIEFDPDWSAPGDYARLYRTLGIQAVPALTPDQDPEQWKRPAIAWKAHTKKLASPQDLDDWFAQGYQGNVGMLTGAASGGLFILDLDISRHIEAEAWWEALTTANGKLDTPTQITGGGGLQLLLRAPEGWTAPTGKTAIGVDVRGEGGFAMLPPSVHESGYHYQWMPDYEPWAMEAVVAPAWLTEAIDALLGAHRASGESGATTHTPTPGYQRSIAGDLMDGREGYMTQMVWARVVDAYRESPILPADLKERMRDAFKNYESHTKSRIDEPGTPNHILLEREGRGITAFRQRWEHALTKWDSEVAQAAAKPSPSAPKGRDALTTPEGVRVDPDTGEVLTGFEEQQVVLYRALNPAEIYALPDPEWLIEGLIIERGMGFIYGKPGAGKSFVALDMSLRIATKKAEWFGRPIAKTGGVVYVSSEGVADMKFRMKAWGVANDLDLVDHPFHLIPDAVNFMDAKDLEKLWATLDSVVARSQGLVLIVVDTVSRVLPGADENLQKDMTMFIGAVDGIRERYGVATIGVHHTSREGNLRGSTVFDGAGDFLLSVEKAEDSPTGVLHATKIKAAVDGWRVPYEMRATPTGDLKGTQSLVVYRVEAQEPTPIQNGWPERRVITAVLQEIERQWEAGTPWSTAPQTRQEGRFALANMVRFGMDRATAEAVMESWFRDAVVTIETADGHRKIKGLKVLKTVAKDTPDSFG